MEGEKGYEYFTAARGRREGSALYKRQNRRTGRTRADSGVAAVNWTYTPVDVLGLVQQEEMCSLQQDPAAPSTPKTDCLPSKTSFITANGAPVPLICNVLLFHRFRETMFGNRVHGESHKRR